MSEAIGLYSSGVNLFCRLFSPGAKDISKIHMANLSEDSRNPKIWRIGVGFISFSMVYYRQHRRVVEDEVIGAIADN